ncbi:MAG: hypothetical protein P9M08_06400 [Candidatus Erginobacter occultus]|nr:hypothetical protein [Candidatus Erginobacter occultus]
MMKRILVITAILALAAVPAMAQEWTLSTELGEEPIEALAVAPDGTAWAGQGNSIYRFDGASWSIITTVTGWTDLAFYGAATPANDRAYFSGLGYPPAGGSKSSVPTSIYLPIVLRQSGGAGKSLSWWEVGLLVAPWDYSAHLWAVANASSGYDVWAAAGDGGIYKSSNDGASWDSHTSNVTGVGYFTGIAGSGPSDIWAAGGDSVRYNPCLYHYTGTGWELFTSASMGDTPSVCVPVSQTPWYAFAGSGYTKVGKYDGGWVSLTAFPDHVSKCITSNPQSGEVWVGTRNYGTSPATGNIFYSSNGMDWYAQTSLPAAVYALDASYPGAVWAGGNGKVYYLQQHARRTDHRGDYNGDGTCDLSIYRRNTGLWAVRGVTRAYFGGPSDSIVPGDYSGDGTWNPAIFRPATGLWAVRGVTRAYFGNFSDQPVPGDYRGDGTYAPGIFRPTTGLWAVRGVTRVYFGNSLDHPVPGDYHGDGTWNPGIFRPTTGLWAARGVTRVYFGNLSDHPVPGDYHGDGTWNPGIFRPAAGLWAARGITRAYFGSLGDIPAVSTTNTGR